MAYDIFISYRRTDNKGYTTGTSIARSIKQQLELERYKDRIFFDYSNLHDEEFEKIILSAIEQSRIFILVLTQDAMMRCVNPNDWVRREIMHAQKCGLKIIPINPDNLFNGYPNEFPKELEIVRKIQHTTIHMDASFESDIRLLIEKRIEPALQNSNTPSKTSTTAGALVRIEADLDCHILRFGKEIATARADELEELRLPKGKHKLSFISLDEKSIHEDIMLTINDIEFEEYIEINLRERYDALKAEQEQQRKAEEAALKKAQEEKARQEAEKRRQAAEEARKKADEKKRIEEEERLRKLEEEARKKAEEEKESAPTKEQLIEWYNAGLKAKTKKQAFVFFLKAAEGGLAEAQYELGSCYGSGAGITKDLTEHVKWVMKSAEGGYAKAQHWMYNLHRFGVLSAEKNIFKAIKWLKEAVKQNYPEAIEELKLIPSFEDKRNFIRATKTKELYIAGYLEPDNNLAIEYICQAANEGYVEAQYQLAQGYRSGALGVHSVEEDAVQSAKWMKIAADNGHPLAIDELKDIPEIVRPKRITKKFSQLEELFIASHFTIDDDLRLDYLTRAANGGLVEAQCELGDCYNCGIGVDENEEEAAKWFQKAAEQGHAEAQYRLGVWYNCGIGVDENKEEAIKWYKKAAEQGHAEAQLQLGDCYYYGSGVDENEEEAEIWYSRAAEQGHDEAQYMLGVYWEEKAKTKKEESVKSWHLATAKKWYQKAADQGNEDAQKALRKIGKGFFGRLFG